MTNRRHCFAQTAALASVSALNAAITNAFAAGASGLLISREYDEMRVESLKTIGTTLRELGKA